MTLSRPRTTGRLLRGSALGLGLLVAGGITAPAAFAIGDAGDPGGTADLDGVEGEESPAPLTGPPSASTTAVAPALEGNFGTGKDFSVTVEPRGDTPGDLSLAGAVFQATPTAAPPGYAGGTGPVDLRDDLAGDQPVICTTDAAGTCTFDGPLAPFSIEDFFASLNGIQRPVPTDGSVAGLASGWYSLTQVSASPGLAPATVAGTFGICGDGGPGCPTSDPVGGVTVGNDSLFRTQLVTTVTDSATGAPVACANYELTGPDYPHDGIGAPEESSAGPVPAECLPATTGAQETTDQPATDVPSSSGGSPSDDTSDGSTDGSDGTDGTTTDTAGTDAAGTDTSGDATSDAGTPGTDGSNQDVPAVDPQAIARHGFVREDDAPVSFGTGVTDTAGTITFSGYFLPAEGYLLTPTALPAGYTADPADAFGITTTAEQAGTAAAVTRTVSGPLAEGAPAPAPSSGGVASAAPTTSTAPGAVTTPAASTPAAGDAAALAVTGTPVETMALFGGGLVVLGAGALGTSTVLRRRARQRV